MTAGTKGVARADREAQILDVACRAFGGAGYAATSVADIADAAGISKPLIYNYFGSKEGLHALCVQHAAGTLWAEFERSSRTGTVGLARAVVTLDGMFKALGPQPWIWRLVFDPTAPSDGASHDALLDYERRLFTLGEDGVGEHRPRRHLRDARGLGEHVPLAGDLVAGPSRRRSRGDDRPVHPDLRDRLRRGRPGDPHRDRALRPARRS
jgi:AcrR family transcriptional regulator